MVQEGVGFSGGFHESGKWERTAEVRVRKKKKPNKQKTQRSKNRGNLRWKTQKCASSYYNYH